MTCTDDYRSLLATGPEAVLVEVPHGVQDEIVLWALDHGLHVLLGGVPATSSAAAETIRDRAAARHLVVEAGYQARYDKMWQAAKAFVADGRLGRPVAARSIALWPGDAASWYYHEEASRGMPLTHMTYCFVNPVRWVLGRRPVKVSAFANRVKETGPETIREETCIANLLLEDDVLYSALAGFVCPERLPAWRVTLIGTEAAMEIMPSETAAEKITFYGPAGAETQDFGTHESAFRAQAEAFLNAVDAAKMGQSSEACLNSPTETLCDVRTAEAIVASAREGRTVTL
jgi:predicted dehydrogenase